MNNVFFIGRINLDIFIPIFGKLITNEVIMTAERIDHVKERHPNDFERYFNYIGDIIENPDYILEANKPHSAVLLKRFDSIGKNYKIILRFITSSDPMEFKNSVISFQKVEDVRYNRYKKSEKVLYKRE